MKVTLPYEIYGLVNEPCLASIVLSRSLTLGAGWKGFRVVKFTVPEGVTDGSEAYEVVHGRVHVDKHCGKEEEVAECVIVILCTSWLGAVTLCRVEGCPEG